MALQMPHPYATKSGSYYLNVKVPLALRALARGQRVSLPVAGEQYSVVVSDKVFLSLRTKEAKIARECFPLALAALNAFFESLGQPSQDLGRADARALAGEIYKQAVSDIDHDDAVADEVEAYRDAFAEATAHHLSEGASETIAELEAAIEMPGERALLAWGLKYGDPQISCAELLERYFGPMVDDLIAKYQMRVDAGTRAKLLNAAEQLGHDFLETAERRLKTFDYSDPVGEIGGAGLSITGFLTNRPETVTVIDLKILEFSAWTLNGAPCHVHHPAAKLQEVEIPLAPPPNVPVPLGLSPTPLGRLARVSVRCRNRPDAFGCGVL